MRRWYQIDPNRLVKNDPDKIWNKIDRKLKTGSDRKWPAPFSWLMTHGEWVIGASWKYHQKIRRPWPPIRRRDNCILRPLMVAPDWLKLVPRVSKGCFRQFLLFFCVGGTWFDQNGLQKNDQYKIWNKIGHKTWTFGRFFHFLKKWQSKIRLCRPEYPM